ncbi:MAG: hypothetical protein JZU45_14180 [Methyloversatilis discipulorum]|uniref:hypothetical protein n=1 Tax=Methyloversatilis discipulorum TaxID=1119528 RepID=UPI0026F1D98A|nr:hypothetical protein [Methyloversatilis discipulorum]MBV5287225.1 hypothetical protein [Methyloversatilis discipulorum]
MSGFVVALIAVAALLWLLTGSLRRRRERQHDPHADNSGLPGSSNDSGCASVSDGGSDCGGGGGDGGGGD